jgi:hypothetical protein
VTFAFFLAFVILYASGRNNFLITATERAEGKRGGKIKQSEHVKNCHPSITRPAVIITVWRKFYFISKNKNILKKVFSIFLVRRAAYKV